MKKIRQIYRLFHINFTLIKHGLDKIVLSIPLLAPISFLAYLNPWNWYTKDQKSRGEKIRLALVELGPVFIKFGQMLSIRGDILPEDIIAELEKLQDRVPPFPSDQAKTIIEQAYGQTIKELFLTFDSEPMASASIAQIHAAKLSDGSEVIIKVVRPGIEKIIRRDIDALNLLAKLAQRFWSQGHRLHPVEVVAEFERNIFDELDLVREAANASQLRRNFLNSPILYIPEIHWPYAQTNVIAMERIYGIPITDIDALKRHHIDLKELAEKGVEIFFTQVFRDCFFHADMHPGNIFVDPNNAQYIAVDFGIMGTLGPSDQRYLAGNFLAFFQRNYRHIAELHIESGWVPRDTRVDEFESAMRTVLEPMFERPLKDLSFGNILMRLFQVGRRFQMEIQPQLLLLQKTLLNIEGLGRTLYPELDLWTTAKPFLENWLSKQIGPRAFLDKLQKQFPAWATQFPELPTLAYEALQTIKQSRHTTELQSHKQLCTQEKQSIKKRSLFQGAGVAIILAALISSLFITPGITASDSLDLLNTSLLIAGILALIVGHLL